MDSGTENYLRFLNGSDDGFIEIIRTYMDGLILYLNSFVGNIHTAEDLAEDTFVRIVTKKPVFRQECSFKTWLYSIGRNIAVDYCRNNRNRNALSAEECLQSQQDTETLEQLYIQTEKKISVHRAMQNLKKEYRQVLWLTYFEGLSNKETAKNAFLMFGFITFLIRPP